MPPLSTLLSRTSMEVVIGHDMLRNHRPASSTMLRAPGEEAILNNRSTGKAVLEPWRLGIEWLRLLHSSSLADYSQVFDSMGILLVEAGKGDRKHGYLSDILPMMKHTKTV